MYGGPYIECDPANPRHPGIDSGLRLITHGHCDYLGHDLACTGADAFGGRPLVAMTRGLGSEPDMHVATYRYGMDGLGWYLTDTEIKI